MDNQNKTETAILGGGCFWCTEAVFLRLKGVISVESGYSGGEKPNPTYEEVSTGRTGHAEVIKISFDPSKISFNELLEVFFATHDATTMNRQGADIGTQYRSAIFPMTEQQKDTAEHFIKNLNSTEQYDGKITTTTEPYTNFYIAENYHQNYYNNHQNQSYCSIVISPKIKKLMEKFGEKVK